MGWDEVRNTIDPFNHAIRSLNLSIPDDSPVGLQFQTLRAFLADQASMTQAALSAKWREPEFKRVFEAAIIVFRLTRSVVALQAQPRRRLKCTLEPVLAGNITQDFSPCQAKDFFYELELAYFLQRAGFSVTLREPDVMIEGNGLSRPIGLACKYPSSEQQVHAHISKGYSQLTGQQLPGVVAFGMELLIFRKVFARATG